MKINIPESFKEVLSCCECNELLSCGPVYLVHGTSEAVCGRCSLQPQKEEKDPTSKSNIGKRSRNLQYEATAKLLSFPCQYANQGCPEKMDFAAEEPNTHELDCKFRNFFCPIVTRDSCDWLGSSIKLSEHCQTVHPTYFSQNPFVSPRLDLTKPNLSNFLISAFNFLFLVHIKICVASGKLYHSIRMFGDSKFLDKFSYSLEINGNGSKVKKDCSVIRARMLKIQESTANCIFINSLSDLLGGNYDKSEFTITIQTLIRNCFNCLKNYDYVDDLKFCNECHRKLVKCKFYTQGCSFVDVNEEKCWKHQNYFCEYQTKCYLCEVNFIGGSFIEHLSSSTACRETTISNLDSVVRLKRTSYSYFNYILFSSNNFGTIICSYKLFNSSLFLYLRTSLPSHELKKLKCSIELTDPQSKRNQILTPQNIYNNSQDWYFNERMNNLISWENIGIDIKITIENNVINVSSSDLNI